MVGPIASSPAKPSIAVPTAVRDAAQGVEAMFLRQVLAAARATSLAGEDDIFGSSSAGTFTEMRDATFADIAAKTGSLGLARMFAAKLARDAR